MERFKGETTGIRQKCIRSLVDVIVLNLLKNKPMCGYEIIESIYDRTHVLLSPGTVYPLLDSLQMKGLIDNKVDGRKRIYMITNIGKEAFERMSAEYVKTQAIFSVGFGVETEGYINRRK